MTKLKFKQHERVTRAEAAARLTEIAEALRNGAEFELTRGGATLELEVPEDVLLEFEVEIEGGKAEIEVEITWGSGADPATSSESELLY